MCADFCQAEEMRCILVLLYQGPCWDCCCSEYCGTVYIYLHGTVCVTSWRRRVETCHGQSSSIIIIVPKICAVSKVLKYVKIDNCERSEEMSGNVNWGVYQERMWYSCRIAESLFCTTVSFLIFEALSLVYKGCSISWDEMNMIWRTSEFWFQTCCVALVTGARLYCAQGRQ